jgi:hypothetical protein
LASSSGASTSSRTQIGEGIGEEHGEDQGERGQRLLAARQQRQRRGLLAGRLGDDLEPTLQRVLGFQHFQPRLAAAEQRREKALEMPVDRIEGCLQAGAAFGVDLRDARAQLGDGRLDVALLLVHARELLRQAGELLVGLQVDTAQPLAVGLEAQELAVGLLKFGHRGAGLHARKGQAPVRAATQLIADAPSLLRAPLARVLQPGLDARARLALVGDGCLRCAQRLRRLPVRGFGLGQPIGGRLPVALGAGDLAQELLALLLDHRRQLGDVGGLGLSHGDALVERPNLRLGAGRAGAPALVFGNDGGLALGARSMLALERDELGPGLARARAQRCRLGLGCCELPFQRLEPSQRVQRPLGLRQ